MSAELYDSLWLAWRDGTRSKNQLARMFNLSNQTIDRVVEKGYITQQWPSLRERSKLYDAQKLHAEQKAQQERLLEENDEWRKLRRQNLQLGAALMAGIAQLDRKVVDAAAKATFVKQRRVKSKDGDWIWVDVPPNAFELTDAVRTLAQAKRELGQHMSFWMGGPQAPAEESGAPTKAMRAFADLTEEQARYILENDGKLPPGLSDAELFGTASQPAKG